MKKVITVLMALTMVFGVASIAAADCLNCNGIAGNIARGCEGDQENCSPFDFENSRDYCDSKDYDNRAIFKICDCITDGDFQTVVTGDTIDITMEILVNGETGNNGVYWAEYVGSEDNQLGLNLYSSQDDACDDLTDSESSQYYDDEFAGYFEYLLANGDEGYPNDDSDDCSLDDSERVIKIQPDREANGIYGDHGYVIDEFDEIAGNASWEIDIPEMRVDGMMVNAGDQVWVRICLQLDCSGICSEAIECCCDIYIGELCCSFDTAGEANMIYPYFPRADTAVWNLLGITVSNIGAIDGEATFVMYENDGDMGEVTIPVDGRGIYLDTLPNLVSQMTASGPGTLGDDISYIIVTADFPASGFVMIADTLDGASMGYIPQQGWQTLSLGSIADLMDK